MRDRLLCGVGVPVFQKCFLGKPKRILNRVTEVAMAMETAEKNAETS